MHLLLKILFILPVCFPGIPAEEERAVTIAVVRDGPGEYYDGMRDLVKKELLTLLGDERQIFFKEKPSFNAGGEPDRVREVLENALADPEVDLLLLLGVLTTEAATHGDLELGKPVFSGLVQDARSVGLPLTEDGRSGKKNLSFVASRNRIADDLAVFKSLGNFRTVHFLVDEKLLQGLKSLDQRKSYYEELTGLQIDFLPIYPEAEKTLAGIGPEVEAIYYTPAVRTPLEERRKLYEGVNERKILSFHLFGQPEVLEGVLAGLAPYKFQRLARRVALNIQQVILGGAPNDLLVFLLVEDRLTINAKTAKQIGFSPPFAILDQAEILFQEEMETGDRLDLEKAVRVALRNNVDLAVGSEEVEVVRQASKIAGSFLLPQVHSNLNYAQVNRDQAERSNRVLPERVSSFGFTASQVVFDDSLISQFRTSLRQSESRELEQDALRLDVMERASRSFLQFLSSRALHRISKENLKLTQSNLELARLRKNLGQTGPEEIFRWEAEEARQRSAVNEAFSAEEQARLALNQTLGVDLWIRWIPESIELQEDEMFFLEDRLRQFVVNPVTLEHFRRFAVTEALRNSPSLQALKKSIEGQELLVDQKSRRFFLPTVSTFFDWNYQLTRNFEGTDLNTLLIGAGVPLPPATSADRDSWTFGVTLSLPLFEGGRRFHEVQQNKARYRQLIQTKLLVTQLLEQRTQSAIYAMQNSLPNIRLSREAARAAQENLEVVRDKYANGAVTILDLLDAQNQSLVQRQAAAIAVFKYLENLMEFQRSISWFEMEKEPSERTDFLLRAGQFVRGMTK